MLALLACFAVQFAIAAMLGFFTRLFLAAHWQVHIAWWPLSMLFVAIFWILGIRRVEVGGGYSAY